MPVPKTTLYKFTPLARAWPRRLVSGSLTTLAAKDEEDDAAALEAVVVRVVALLPGGRVWLDPKMVHVLQESLRLGGRGGRKGDGAGGRQEQQRCGAAWHAADASARGVGGARAARHGGIIGGTRATVAPLRPLMIQVDGPAGASPRAPSDRMDEERTKISSACSVSVD